MRGEPTGNQGPLERNQKLSRDRKTPEGVGPLAPVAANDAEAGRAKNRRVEMVLR